MDKQNNYSYLNDYFSIRSLITTLNFIYLLKSLSEAITTNHASLNFPHKVLSLFNW